MIDRIISALADDCAACRPARQRQRGLVHCPAHPDPTPSLNVDERDGKVLVKCHAGCSQEDVVTALRERGLWDAPKAIVNRGVPFETPETQREVARYRYENADGSHAYDIIRFEPKTFRADRQVPEETRVLYHLPEVISAVAERKLVAVCEGEKDADALRGLGVTATSAPFGAGKFLERYAETLIGADVVICADKDEPGRAHAKDVAQKLSVAARSVKILEFPVGKDAADWVESGGSLLHLLALVAETPEWTDGERVIWTMPELSREYREIIAKRLSGDPEHVGWRLGFRRLDENLRYRAGEFWVIAAATSVGKSAFMQSLQRRCPVPSLYFSLEMSRTQMMDRLAAAEADIDSWKISSGNLDTDEQRRLDAAIARIEQMDLPNIVESTLTAGGIESVLRIARVRFGVRVAFVDYAGLIVEKDAESRYVQVTNIAHALQRTAHSVRVCVIAGSQVNRKGNRQDGSPPHIDELRDSGVLAEDPDVVLALGRAEGSSEAKVKVLKNRNGLSGYTETLAFDALHAQFTEPGEAKMQQADARSGRREEAEEIPF